MRDYLDESEVPDVLLDPPDRYPKIRNKFGCCGLKPNLYYNGTVHRIWVMHAVNGVEYSDDIDEYVDQYGGFGNLTPNREEKREDMKEAVRQALDFYYEFQETFDEEVERREKEVREAFEDATHVIEVPDDEDEAEALREHPSVVLVDPEVIDEE